MKRYIFMPMDNNRKVAIFGASINPNRYAYLAAEMLNRHGFPIELISIKKGELFSKTFLPFGTIIHDIHTITLYINPTIQTQYFEYILSLNPKRIICNPGTENDKLFDLANSKGIIYEEACTLVLLQTGQF